MPFEMLANFPAVHGFSVTGPAGPEAPGSAPQKRQRYNGQAAP